MNLPFVFSSGEHGFYYLIDYTKDSGEAVVFKDFPAFNPHSVIPHSIILRDRRPSIKVISPMVSNYLLRLSYLSTGSSSALSLEDSTIMPFGIKKMQEVVGTDFVFVKNDLNAVKKYNDVYLINVLGPLSQNSGILKKVFLPLSLSEDSAEIIQTNHVFGRNQEDLIQVWIASGRVLVLTFPKTGEEPKLHGEVWHKGWKERFPARSPSLHFNSRFFPKTREYFSCLGCGEDGTAPCLYSWQCHSSCSSCSGPSEGECSSCPSSFTLENGACIKNCQNNQYRKSRSTCLDCPSDHILIRSNLTCLNCWDHNDYEECSFTKLGYNISLVESFLNISFTYQIDFFGEGRSLEKLENEIINWQKIFKIYSIKDKKSDPECEKPIYKFDGDNKRLTIRMNECQRKSRFYLRALRSKLIIERFKVPLMINLTTGSKYGSKVIDTDDDISLYSRGLRFIIWALYLIFFLYLILSKTEFAKNQPIKLIGNFLKMIDFIQSLSLIEVRYKVLVSKFFWMIQLIFSSPQFGLFEAYLNDESDVKREVSREDL